MKKNLLFSLAAGVCYGVWPIFANLTRFNPQLMSLGVMVSGTTVWFIYMATNPQLFQGIQQISTPKPLIFLAVAGIINALGLFFYSKVIGSQEIDISKYITIALIIATASAAISAKIFINQPLTTTKIIGLLCAALAIWLLR